MTVRWLVVLTLIGLITSCNSSQTSVVTATPTQENRVSKAAGYALEIFYGADANDFERSLDSQQLSFPNEAYQEGWLPWIAKILIENPRTSGFMCISGKPDSLTGDLRTVSVTDSGGYARTARLYVRTSIYGLRWNVCDGGAVMAYVLGAIPASFQPKSGVLETREFDLPIDFSVGASANFPLSRGDIATPNASHTITHSQWHMEIKTIPQTSETSNLGERISLQVAVTNTGGYNLGSFKMQAIDNLGRFYNDTFGSFNMIAPGLTKTVDMAIYNPFPARSTASVTTAFVMVFMEYEPDLFRYAGSVLIDLVETAAQPLPDPTATPVRPDVEEDLAMIDETIYQAESALLSGFELGVIAPYFRASSLINSYSLNSWMNCFTDGFTLNLHIPTSRDAISIVDAETDLYDLDNIKMAVEITSYTTVEIQCDQGGTVVHDTEVRNEPIQRYIYLHRGGEGWQVVELCYMVEQCDYDEMPVFPE